MLKMNSTNLFGFIIMALIYLPLFVNLYEVLETPENSSNNLSRRKRYVTFPEGASFSMAACLTVGVLGQPLPGIFTWGLNWGIAYELPNETQSIESFKKLRKLPRPLVARRFRRDFYSKMELVMNDMGYNGRECILRSLCEAAQHLQPNGGSMIEELFRTIFTLPLAKVVISEPDENVIYDHAHKSGLRGINCHEIFQKCPFSLLDLALGYYTPSAKYK